MTRRSRKWCKVWIEYFDTPSHELIPPELLGLGVKLILLALPQEDPFVSDASAWLQSPAGEPWPVDNIARRLGVSTERTNELLEALVAVGTMAVRSDGAYGFPKWWRYQESPDAQKQRRKRADRPPPLSDNSASASASASPGVAGGGGVGEGVPAAVKAHENMRRLKQAAIMACGIEVDERSQPVRGAIERIGDGSVTVDEALHVIRTAPRGELGHCFWKRNIERTKQRFVPRQPPPPPPREERPEYQPASEEQQAMASSFLEELKGRLAEEKRW